MLTSNAPAVAAQLRRHCGGLFIGPSAAEVLGDYGQGPQSRAAHRRDGPVPSRALSLYIPARADMAPGRRSCRM